MADQNQFTEEELSGPVVDRRTTIKLIGAAGLTGLAGCNSDDSADQTGGETDDSGGDGGDDDTEQDTSNDTGTNDRSGGRLSAAWYRSDITTLDPQFNAEAEEFPLVANIFNGLVWLAEDLTLRGDLAEDWEIQDDGRTMVFTLREDVTFHNGDEFTADDVQYTINRAIEEESPHAGKLDLLNTPVEGEGVVVEDDYTVSFNFEEPFAPVLIYLSRASGRVGTIVNQTAIEEMGADQYGVTPVGTGPFEVTDRTPGESITLDAFDDYFRTDENGNQLPHVDGVDVNLIPEASTLVNAITSGQVDFVDRVPLENLDTLESANDVEKISGPGVNDQIFAINQAAEPFTDANVRLALAKSIDREAYSDDAHFGNSIPALGPINQGIEWAWREDKPDYQAYDPEGAQELLDEAGESEPSFELMVNPAAERDGRVAVDQLQQAGWDAQLNQVDDTTFGERYLNGNFSVLIGTHGGVFDPDQTIYRYFYPGASENIGGYENERATELMDQQRHQLDRDERTETLHELEDVLMEDAPYGWLAHKDNVLAARSSVNGYVNIPGVRYLETIWLDE